MQVSYYEKNGILRVHLKGRLTLVTECLFNTELASVLTKSSKIIFDCSQLDYIDSTGLGALLRFCMECKKLGGRIVLACLQEKPIMVFEITYAYKLFEIFDSLELAEKSFK